MKDIEKHIIGFILGAVVMGAAGLYDRHRIRKHYYKTPPCFFRLTDSKGKEWEVKRAVIWLDDGGMLSLGLTNKTQ